LAQSDGSERRRVGRRPIPGIEATLRAPGDVKVIDVGVFGMAIEAPADLAPGERIFLELRHGKHTANVEVKVRWQKVAQVVRARDTFVPVSRAGVEFSEVYREQTGGIWDFILVPPQRLR
jgi:hypothetical protein